MSEYEILSDQFFKNNAIYYLEEYIILSLLDRLKIKFYCQEDKFFRLQSYFI